MTTPSWSSAASRLTEVRKNISDEALRLAYHAALPVVLDSGFLNLLRVNFFLDPPEDLPFEAEASLLLSPLFREIGDDLYEIEPEVRNVLLLGLQTRYGRERVGQIAVLLEQYTELTPAWHAQPELEQAQLLTALSFIDPAKAETWLEDAGSAGAGQILGQDWFVAMRHRLMGQPNITTIRQEAALAAERLSSERLEARMAGLHTLALLSHLPDTDTGPIVSALARFLRDHAANPPMRVTPDAQAALALIGTTPRSSALDLRGIVLVGADLQGLDLSGGKLQSSRFRDCLATGLSLRGADLSEARLENVQADRADLTRANLGRAYLYRVSFRNAAMAGVSLKQASLHTVDFSGANLEDAIPPDAWSIISELSVDLKDIDIADTGFRGISRPRRSADPVLAEAAVLAQRIDAVVPHSPSILVVDDDAEWLRLIKESLPQYKVDVAQAYNQALEALRAGRPYDVAIVDLNLLDSSIRDRDLLGGIILEELRVKHPSTQRIALTGLPPGAVRREVFDRYDPYDLLLKQNVTLSDIRSMVQAAVAAKLADNPPDVVAQKSQLSDAFARWAAVTSARFRQQAQTLQDALREAGQTASGAGTAEQDMGPMTSRLSEVKSQLTTFDSRCSNIENMLAMAHSAEEISFVARKIDELKRQWGRES